MDKSIRTPNPKNTPITYPYYSSSRSNTPCHSSTHNRDVLSKDIGWRHDRRFAGYFFSFFFSFEFPYIIGVFLYFLQSTRQSGCVWNSGCATTSFWFGCCVAPIDQKPPCVGVPHRKGAKEDTGDASPPPPDFLTWPGTSTWILLTQFMIELIATHTTTWDSSAPAE